MYLQPKLLSNVLKSIFLIFLNNICASLFSDCLCVELAEVCDKTVGSSPPPRLKPPTTLQNISFQTETDNR